MGMLYDDINALTCESVAIHILSSGWIKDQR